MNLLFIEIAICAASFGICLFFLIFKHSKKNKIIKNFNLYLRTKITNKIINLDIKDLDTKNNEILLVD